VGNFNKLKPRVASAELHFDASHTIGIGYIPARVPTLEPVEAFTIAAIAISPISMALAEWQTAQARAGRDHWGL